MLVKCNTVVRNLLGKCVKCCLYWGKLGKQKMADVPNYRTLEGPPFTNCGVGTFDPFIIKEGAKIIWAISLARRVLHIECTFSMDVH